MRQTPMIPYSVSEGEANDPIHPNPGLPSPKQPYPYRPKPFSGARDSALPWRTGLVREEAKRVAEQYVDYQTSTSQTRPPHTRPSRHTPNQTTPDLLPSNFPNTVFALSRRWGRVPKGKLNRTHSNPGQSKPYLAIPSLATPHQPTPNNSPTDMPTRCRRGGAKYARKPRWATVR